MVFSSIGFLGLFFPVVFFLYHLAPRAWKNPVLAFASILFYAWGEPRFVILMLVSVVANFRFAIAIARRADPARRLRLLACAVALNLLLLVIFKYTNFLVDNANVLLGLFGKSLGHVAAITLPIGVSFYTFHAISYLIDIHRGNAKPNSSLVQYSLYIMLFPQLVAGPIIRYKDIHTQLPARQVALDDINAGILRFTMGLAKKVLIANPLGLIADAGFDSPAADLAASDAWLYLLCYTLQIYFDFSGYSDMAIGLARMFGFRFPENFNYPYTARSIQDFWRRWHISLSTWFRDYVYVPLGGNRHGEWRTLRNLWIVFLLTGLWHGASWNFVIWGALHGFFLMLERLGRAPGAARWAPPAVLAHVYTMMVVMLAWVFFRANTLGEALDFLRALAGYWGVAPSDPNPSLNPRTAIVIGVAGLIASGAYPRLLALAAPMGARLQRHGIDAWLRAGFVAPALVLCFMSVALGQYNPFIYFRF